MVRTKGISSEGKMQGRTFFRIMIDNLFVKNPLCMAIIAFVNLCNNCSIYNRRNLKFLKKMPLNNNDSVGINYKNKFVFDSSKVIGVNIK